MAVINVLSLVEAVGGLLTFIFGFVLTFFDLLQMWKGRDWYHRYWIERTAFRLDAYCIDVKSSKWSVFADIQLAPRRRLELPPSFCKLTLRPTVFRFRRSELITDATPLDALFEITADAQTRAFIQLNRHRWRPLQSFVCRWRHRVSSMRCNRHGISVEFLNRYARGRVLDSFVRELVAFANAFYATLALPPLKDPLPSLPTSRWWVARRAGHAAGSFGSAQLARALADGDLSPMALVRSDSGAEWKPLALQSELKALFAWDFVAKDADGRPEVAAMDEQPISIPKLPFLPQLKDLFDWGSLVKGNELASDPPVEPCRPGLLARAAQRPWAMHLALGVVGFGLWLLSAAKAAAWTHQNEGDAGVLLFLGWPMLFAGLWVAASIMLLRGLWWRNRRRWRHLLEGGIGLGEHRSAREGDTSSSAFESVSELGPVQSEHAVRYFRLLARGLLGVLYVGVGIFMLVCVQASAEGSVGNVLSAAMFKGLYSLPFLGLGLMCFRSVYGNWGAAVVVFDRGFAVTHGKSVRRIPWEDVIAVGQFVSAIGLGPWVPREHSVQLTDGTKYTWDSRYYEDAASLGETIAIQTDFADVLHPTREE